jgi:hypothetical protein
MSVAEQFSFYSSVQLEGLGLRDVAAALAEQVAPVTAILVGYDGDANRLRADSHLSPEGRLAKLRESHEKAAASVEQWRTARVAGIQAQVEAQRATLQRESAKVIAAPTERQVQQMAERLSAFDPLEVAVLYGDATDEERQLMEAASLSLGRMPRKRGEQLVWEPLLAPERVAASVAARAARVAPVAAAAVADSERIHRLYDTLANAAGQLLRDSVPTAPTV